MFLAMLQAYKFIGCLSHKNQVPNCKDIVLLGDRHNLHQYFAYLIIVIHGFLTALGLDHKVILIS
jgi:hypothetical protein